MAEKIFILDGSGNLESMEETPFAAEEILQELIANHPELLAGEQMSPDNPRRWILIAREKGIAETTDAGHRWSIDHVYIDQDAVPTLVEAKRGANTEIRRTIVGQLLEYAAHATLTWGVNDLRSIFEERNPDHSAMVARLLDSGEDVDEDSFWSDVETNLNARNIRLLFVADEIPDSLARIVEFLNAQMPRIEVLAVEIKQFKGKTNRTLVPNVIGRTAKSSISSGTSGSRRHTRESFLGRFANDSERQAAVRLFETATRAGATLAWTTRGVSIRKGCSLWPSPITIAWLYPELGTMWNRTKEFTFGAAIFDYDPPPSDELRTCLENWANQFKDDTFTTDVSSVGVKAYSVSYADAVKHIDILEDRMRNVLEQLGEL